jgi:hypothetical protein
VRNSYNLSSSFCYFGREAGVDTLRGVVFPREVELINVLAGIRMKLQAQAERSNTSGEPSAKKAKKMMGPISSWLRTSLIDVSQRVSRVARASVTTTPCLTTSTNLFSLHRERLISPSETSCLQGWPSHYLTSRTDLTNEELKQAVGEGMCVPCVTTILAAVLVATVMEHRL